MLGDVPQTRPGAGFDLDMTLVDSFGGIAATMTATLAEAGVGVSPEQIWPHIGIMLEDTLAILAPGLDAATLATRYRELYPRIGVPATTLLPGALEALEAVRAAGLRTLVISAKAESGVRQVLRRVGLDDGPYVPDVVVGGLFAAGKGVRLKREGAVVYVGDHPGDVHAARVAGAVAVAVATGPTSADRLADAGADVVLPDLHGFPAWWASGSVGRADADPPAGAG